ncbi:MAG: hypothetical protein ACREQY_12695 [Candidatus Binatia bacterium]
MTEAEPKPPNGKPRGARASFGALMLFIGAFFGLLTAQESCWQENAERITGVVIEKGFERGSSGVRGSAGTKSYHWIRYRYATPEGETKEHLDTEVLPDTWRELQEGGPIDLEFLAATRDSRVAGQKAYPLTYALITVALIVAGIALRRSGRRAP